MVAAQRSQRTLYRTDRITSMPSFLRQLVGAPLPFMSRPHALIEFRAWLLFAVPQGIMSGSIVGVLARNIFAEQGSPWALALAVAVVTGATPLANLASLFWSQLAQGQDRVRLLSTVQTLFAVSLVSLGLLPINGFGLLMMVLLVVATQFFWSGLLTIRSAVWRANYDRAGRTAFTARMLMVTAVVMAATGVITGVLVDRDIEFFRLIFLAAGGFALLGMLTYRGLRVRRQRQLINAERTLMAGQRFRPRAFVDIWRNDPLFRNYLIVTFISGSGNLMFMAPLILVMNNNLQLPQVQQILVTASLPTLLIPLLIPWWARVFARHHVIAFRARLNWCFAGALAAFFAAALSQWPALLWLGAVLLGSGWAGGRLGWNLGHNDFAPDDERATEYMGLHVTLTGVRGSVVPLIGVALYQALETSLPGLGVWSLLLPFSLSLTGTIGFVLLARRMKAPPRGAEAL